MLTPLWSHSRDRWPTVPVKAEPFGFDVGGKKFLYEPNDMRLYLCDEESRRAALAEEVMTARPVFNLPDVKPQMAVLVVTHACPLRCRYCFAEPGSAKDEPVVMSLDTAKQAVDLIPPGREFTIGFFGGEPLVAPELIRETVKYAQEVARARGTRAKFSVTTNAVLLTGDLSRFFAENEFGMIVSLDGPKHLHDAARPRADGSGSYDDTLAGLKMVAEYPALARRTTLRGTFDGLENESYLVERLQHLNEIAWEYGFGNVSVEPADISEGCGKKPARKADDGGCGCTSICANDSSVCGGSDHGSEKVKPVKPSENLFAEYLRAAEWFVQQLREGRSPKFHHLTVRAKRLAMRTPAPSECGAGVGYFAVDPAGKIFACHRLGECGVGELPHGIDCAAQAQWRDNRYYQRAYCPECGLRNVCGGGCRLNSIHQCGDIRQPDPLGCWITQTCFRAAAWVLAELKVDGLSG